jgi:uncharacterized protein YidB (DUF937 family)
MRAQGLGPEADSWVGTGQNQPITGAQVRRVIGENEVAGIARAAGASPDDAAEGIAQLLPGLVDVASPGGKLAAPEDVNRAFEELHRTLASAGR